MFAIRLLEEGGETANSMGWLVWVALAVFFLMVFLGWLVASKGWLKKEEAPVAHGGHDEHGHDDHGHAPAAEAHAGPDKLTTLEGVGPKVETVLHGLGITTFAQLAVADPVKLKEALSAAGYKYMEPAGWIEQAQFAARGDKEGLAKLQGELKGGRRVS